MMFQINIDGMEWILGLGIVFALAFIFTLLTIQELPVFIAFLTIFDGFAVWTALLPLWTLIMFIIILTVVVYMEFAKKKVIE